MRLVLRVSPPLRSQYTFLSCKLHRPPCEVFRAENDTNRIDAGRRLGSVVRGSDGPV